MKLKLAYIQDESTHSFIQASTVNSYTFSQLPSHLRALYIA